MNQLLNTIFSNNSKLSTMNNQINKETNPLFPIARKKHNEAFLTWEYDFLHMTTANENCFILGFCGGVGHASDIFSKQIEEFKNKLAELNKLATEKENELLDKIGKLEKEIAAPTINRY